jgi:hypothetical protein
VRHPKTQTIHLATYQPSKDFGSRLKSLPCIQPHITLCGMAIFPAMPGRLEDVTCKRCLIIENVGTSDDTTNVDLYGIAGGVPKDKYTEDMGTKHEI